MDSECNHRCKPYLKVFLKKNNRKIERGFRALQT